MQGTGADKHELSASAVDARAVGPDRHRHARRVGSSCAWLRRPSNSRAPKIQFAELIQRDSSCPVVPRKIFRFAAPPKLNLHQFPNFRIQLDNSVETGVDRLIPPYQEGRFAIVTDVRRVAVDADGAVRRAALKRTAKSCGPGAPTLASRSRVESANDGGKRARSPGRGRNKP